LHENELWILIENFDFGPLTNILVETVLNESQIATISRECLIAIDYLHENKIIHRDIKSDNFYVCRNGTIKLVDLGYSVIINDERSKYNSIAGTPCWMAPELIKR
jgi:serine/threonine protein kinase